jgi:hypothetical protein
MDGIKSLKRYVHFPGLAIVLLILVFALGNCGGPTPSVSFLLADDDGSHALHNQEVHVLCYESGPLNSFQFQESITVITDGEGKAQLPGKCAYLAALYKIHEQDHWSSEHGPAYRVYYTSWEPGSNNPTFVEDVIEIKKKWKLTVFDVVVSLEWEPESRYVDSLGAGLRNASEYLYDLSDGQMAFGKITVYTSGEHWNDADLRFLAANDRRPSASVGGIVAARTTYLSSTDRQTDYVPGRVMLGRFWDGDVANYIDKDGDGEWYDNDNGSGEWSQKPGFRTLVHEWAHYALFLYDEYLHTDDARISYCTCYDLDRVGPVPTPTVCGNVGAEMAASAMAYHYTATEFWHPNVTPFPDPSGPSIPASAICDTSIQGYVHGESDWDTLAQLGNIQIPTTTPEPEAREAVNLRIPGSLRPGPDLGTAADLFEFSTGSHSDVPTPTPAPGWMPTNTVLVEIPGNFTSSNLPVSHVYLQKGVTPDRILHQGGVPKDKFDPLSSSGDMTLLDVETVDTTWISIDHYATDSDSNGDRYLYMDKVPAGGSVKVGDHWNVNLDLDYTVTNTHKFTALTVRLTSPGNLEDLGGAEARLCFPDESIGCSKLIPLTHLPIPQCPTPAWCAMFDVSDVFPTKSELPPYGIVQVIKDSQAEAASKAEASNKIELIRWFEDDGGPGPAHVDSDTPLANAPLRDGAAMVDVLGSSEKLLGLPLNCSRVFIMPAADFNAISTSLNTADISIQGIIGTPLDIDIMIPEDCNNPTTGPGDRELPAQAKAILTMFYPRIQLEKLSTLQMASLQQSMNSPTFQSVSAEDLRIVHFDRESCLAGIDECTWELVESFDRNQNLGWVAAEIGEDGIYAIVWVR